MPKQEVLVTNIVGMQCFPSFHTNYLFGESDLADVHNRNRLPALSDDNLYHSSVSPLHL